MISNFHNEVWEWFISSCVAKGMLEAPGFFENKLKKQAYLGISWVGEGALQIDPAKESRFFSKTSRPGSNQQAEHL